MPVPTTPVYSHRNTTTKLADINEPPPGNSLCSTPVESICSLHEQGSAELRQARVTMINEPATSLSIPEAGLVTNARRFSLMPSPTLDQQPQLKRSTPDPGEDTAKFVNHQSVQSDTESETDPNFHSSSVPGERQARYLIGQHLSSLQLDEARTQQALKWMMAPKEHKGLLNYGLSLRLEQMISNPSQLTESTYSVPVELSHRIQRLLQIIIINPRLSDYDGAVIQSVLRSIPFGEARDELPVEYETNLIIQRKVENVIKYHLDFIRQDIFRMLSQAKSEGWSTPKVCRKLLKLVREEALQHTQELWVRWAFLRYMFEHSQHFWTDVNAKLAERQKKFQDQNVTFIDQVNFYLTTYHKRDQKTYPYEKSLSHLLVPWGTLSGLQAELWNTTMVL